MDAAAPAVPEGVTAGQPAPRSIYIRMVVVLHLFSDVRRKGDLQDHFEKAELVNCFHIVAISLDIVLGGYGHGGHDSQSGHNGHSGHVPSAAKTINVGVGGGAAEADMAAAAAARAIYEISKEGEDCSIGADVDSGEGKRDGTDNGIIYNTKPANDLDCGGGGKR